MLIKSQQNQLQPRVDQFATRSINLILFVIYRNCLICGRIWSLCVCIRRVKKQIVVIVETYHFCQIRTKFYPTSCFQGWLHMHRKFWGIIIVDFDAICQMLIIYSAFVRYWKEKRNVMKQRIRFRKAYDSVRKEALCNIRIVSGTLWN